MRIDLSFDDIDEVDAVQRSLLLKSINSIRQYDGVPYFDKDSKCLSALERLFP